MAQYDGNIKINVDVDTKILKAGSKRIESEIRYIAKTVSDSLEESAKIALQKQVDAFTKLNQLYAQQEKKVKSLRNKLQQLQKTKIETPIFKKTLAELEAAQKRLDKLLGDLKNFEIDKGYTSSNKFAEEVKEIINLQEKIKSLSTEMKKLSKESPEYYSANKELKKYQRSLDLVESTVKEQIHVNEKIQNSTSYKKAISQIDLYKQNVKELQEQLKILKLSGEVYQSIDTSKVEQKFVAEERKRIQMYSSLQSYIDGIVQKKSKGDIKKENFVQTRKKEEVVQEDKDCDSNLVNKLGQSGQKMQECEDEVENTKESYERLEKTAKKTLQSMAEFLKSVKFHAASFGEVIKNIGQKIFSVLSKSFIKVSNTIGNGLKNIVKYVLGIINLSNVVSATKEGFQNLALYSDQTNADISAFISNLVQLKNSLATAFAPILTIVTPALTQLISLAAQGAAYIAQFMSALTGKGTYTKAIKVEQDYAESLKGTADAAKEAERSLSAYDKLNTLQRVKEVSGVGEITGPEFEEVEIESSIKEYADQIKDSFLNIFDVFQEVWMNKGQAVIDAAKQAFISLIDAAMVVGQTFYDEFTSDIGVAWVESILNLLRSMLDVINAIATAFTEVWKSGAGLELVNALMVMLTNVNNLLASIGDSFVRVFNTGIGVQIWTNLLGIITGIFNIIGNLAKQIQIAWETSGLGDSIWAGILTIINTILETVHNMADSIAEWTANLDITPLLQSIDTLLKSLEPLTENIGAGLEWFLNNVLLPIASWTIEEAIPVFLNGLSAAIDVLNAVIEVLKPLGSWLWENFLRPLGEWCGETIVSWMGIITEMLKNFGDWIREHQSVIQDFIVVIAAFFAAWEIANLADTIANIIVQLIQFITTGGLATAASTLLGTAIAFLTSPIGIVTIAIGALIAGLVLLVQHWDTVKAAMEKFDQWLTGVFTHDWTEEFGSLGELLNAFFYNVEEIWNSIKEIFNGIIIFIQGVFKGDWQQAWEGIKQVLEGIWDGIIAVVKAPINIVLSMIEKMLNGIVSGINTVIRGLNKFHIKIPDNLLTGEINFGINIPELNMIKIPYLATGAIIPPNKKFLAVLGDQKTGTNIEAPLDTIIDAVKQANKELGVGGGAERIEVILMLDSNVVARELVDLSRQIKKRTGKPLFT